MCLRVNVPACLHAVYPLHDLCGWHSVQKQVDDNASGTNTEIKVKGQKLERVTSFQYLGSFITAEGSKPEILSTIPHPSGLCLWTMDPHSRFSKKNTSHGNQIKPHDIMHLIQRPCYQRGSPCQNPAGNRTTRRPDDRKERQTAVVWSYFPFIRSGQNHLARHSERV